jgi:CHAD domain-containing protein
LRDGLGRKAFDRENHYLRNLAHVLALAREDTAMVETFDKLLEDDPVVDAGTRERIRMELVRRRDKALDKTARTLLHTIRDLLIEAGDRIDQLKLNGNGWDSVMDGLHRSYKRGRKAQQRAADEPSYENYHAWRRRVKDLDYQFRLVNDLWPEAIEQVQEHMDALSQVLGDEHDLGVLYAHLQGEPRAFGAHHKLEPLFKRIETKTHELRSKAHELGKPLYDDKPKAFIDRVAALYQVW